MASIISAGTTSATALNMSADTSGVLQLASNNGTVALTVDTSQNVGVGTASPGSFGKFAVLGTSNSDIGVFVGNQSLTGSAPTYKGSLRIIDNPTGNSTSGGLEFLTSTFGSGYGWRMASIDSSGVQLTFSTRQNSASWTEAMRINTSNNLLIGTTVDYGGRFQAVTDSSRLISNGNGIYRVFTHRTAKASNTTSTCAITFGNQGNQHASHIVEILFAAAQDDANGGVGGRATFLCGSLTGVGTVSEIQDIGTGVSFTASASGNVLTITATTTSNRNVVAWTAKVTSTFVDAAPTSMSIA